MDKNDKTVLEVYTKLFMSSPSEVGCLKLTFREPVTNLGGLTLSPISFPFLRWKHKDAEPDP
jgi:hypothetical protein